METLFAIFTIEKDLRCLCCGINQLSWNPHGIMDIEIAVVI